MKFSAAFLKYPALLALHLVGAIRGYSQTPVFPPELPAGQVSFRLFDGVKDVKTWPATTGQSTGAWSAEQLLAARLPQFYNEMAIRQDRPVPVHLQAFAKVELPAGEHRFLLRSRGQARLWLDGQLLTSLQPPKGRGDGHIPVEAIPKPVAEGARLRRFGDQEIMVNQTVTAGGHEMVLESLVGSSKVRAEPGEMLAAVQINAQGNFLLLNGSKPTVPLTDAALTTVLAASENALQRAESTDRQAKIAATSAPWQARHTQAATWAAAHPVAVPKTDGRTEVDKFLISSWEKQNQAAQGQKAADRIDFNERIRPLLENHCLRCHGAKAKGGLNLEKQENTLLGGDSGMASIIPGQPERSHLLTAVKSRKEDEQMPPEGKRLTSEEISLLETWIKQGASYESTAQAVPMPAQASDAEFLRRTYFHLTGEPASRAERQAFLQDPSPGKRDALVDKLLQQPEFADQWVSYWQDVLAENPNILKPEMNNSGPFRFWLHEALLDGKSLDRFVTELVLMQGSRSQGGTAGFAMATQNDVPMAEKANILAAAFLGSEMKCARCHDAPYHAAKQEQLFQFAALLEEKPLKVPASSSVPVAFFEKNKGRESRIQATLATGAVVNAAWPFRKLNGEPPALPNALQGRELAAWELTHPHNLQFAKVLVNRVWKRLMGKGLVDQVHDWEGREASHPELLEWLARDFMSHGYDLRQVVKRICQTDAWGRTGSGISSQTAFLAPQTRRLSAEQVVDSLRSLCGNGLAPDPLTFDCDGGQNPSLFLNFGETRKAWEFTSLANERDRQALALPKAQAFYDVLEAFGWRSNRPDAVSDRPQESTVLQPAILANGVLTHSLSRLCEANPLTELACTEKSPADLATALWQHFLGRDPNPTELAQAMEMLTPGFAERLTGASATAETSPEDLDLAYRRISWTNHLVTEASEITMRLEKAIRRGPQPSLRLRQDWRETAEDLVWSLINHPEFLRIP